MKSQHLITLVAVLASLLLTACDAFMPEDYSEGRTKLTLPNMRIIYVERYGFVKESANILGYVSDNGAVRDDHYHYVGRIEKKNNKIYRVYNLSGKVGEVDMTTGKVTATTMSNFGKGEGYDIWRAGCTLLLLNEDQLY